MNAQNSTNEGQVLLELDGSVAVIRMGSSDERVIVLDDKRLTSLDAAIADLETREDIQGLIIISAHPKLFCAGADIRVIQSIADPKLGAELARQGQRVFDRIERLKFPTVCAIAGPCVGGGCELALACDYRVLLGDRVTRIGLPETKLGIIPGFGGTQRLPRLVGLPQALDIILKGRVVSPEQAFSMGLADEIVVAEAEEDILAKLESSAKSIVRGELALRRKSLSLRDRLLTFTAAGRALLVSQVRPRLTQGQGKFYPAPKKALDTAVYGLRKGTKRGLEKEAEAIGDLIVTAESKSLVHLYFLSEAATKIGRVARNEIESVAIGVVGAGTMGAGIASVLLQSGFSVSVVDPDSGAQERAKAHIENSLNERRSFSDADRRNALARLSLSKDLSALASSSVVIEAVFEDFEVKQQIYKGLLEVVSKETIIATNTSSLPVTILAESVDNPERMVGMHFFNPAERMPLVEIVRGKYTSDRAVAVTAAVAAKAGKSPVVVGDVPGFLVNRVLTPYLNEAAFLLMEGYQVGDIDRIAKDFGMPMGPLRLLDEVGLDVAQKVSSVMEESYGPRMAGPTFAAKLVESGRKGKKSKEGFYLYGEQREVPNPVLQELLSLPPPIVVGDEEEVRDRLVLAMVNEAVRCLDEGVAGTPGEQAAGQIDLATVMGTGFAPFHGGVLFYIERRGVSEVCQRLAELMERFGERFAPTKGLRQRAHSGASLYGDV